MRCLVTGAAGFIGSRLSRALLDRGDEVIGLDNLNDYYDPALKHRHLRDLFDTKFAPRFTFIEGDLRDRLLLAEIFQKHQLAVVAHLAAMAAVRYSVQHPLVYGEVNLQGSLNLLDAARLGGTTRLVLASTGSVYGKDTPLPFCEDAAAAHPLAPYPASKRAMELFAHSYHHLWNLQITIARFFNVYGPHGRPDMMPWQWARQIAAGKPITLYDGGRLKRDWTYIDDIVAGFVAAIDRPLGFEILNFGCGRPVENVEFVHIIERLLEKKAIIEEVPAPASEPPATFADTSKAHRLIGYTPRVNVEEGLSRFVRWMREEKLLD